jgi:hypothetical protein
MIPVVDPGDLTGPSPVTGREVIDLHPAKGITAGFIVDNHAGLFAWGHEMRGWAVGNGGNEKTGRGLGLVGSTQCQTAPFVSPPRRSTIDDFRSSFFVF